jgi:hypothetical protein
MFESMIESILIYDLGMEGIRRGRESARKIFESEPRNARLHSEGRI